MAIGLQSQIWNNNLRSIALLALYPLVMIGMLWALGAVLGANGFTHGSRDPVITGNHFVFEYWPIMIAVVAIWFTISWFFQAQMIRAATHAHSIDRKDQPELYNLLENLCISRGLPMPKLQIIETPACNAFASGINTNTYTVTVTRGLLQKLKPDEVEGVLAHELTHIINHDVRLLMVCVIFTGMIGFAAQLLWSNIRYSMWVPSGNNRGRNGFLLYFMVLGILVVGYLAGMLSRFALSRSREYMADAGAVELTRNPEAMMRALQRIAGIDRVPAMPVDVAQMCIENSQPFFGMFATHPPIQSRIEAISHMTGTPVPAPEAASGGFTPPWGAAKPFDNPWN